MECLSFQGSEGSTSHLKTGCGQVFIASAIDMHKECFCPGCGTGHFAKHQFTGTLPVSDGRIAELTWTLFTAGSRDRAKTLALQDLGSAWAASEAAYFSRSCAWPKKSSPNSYSLKTSPQLELGGSSMWPKGLPVPAMIVDGTLYPLKKLELRTFVNDGSYLPTPTACDYGKNNGRNTVNARDRYSLTTLATLARHNLWPTPHANCHTGIGRGPNKTGGENLQSAIGGQLNPSWVEWLMGYPSEWTALEDWAIAWFRPKRKKRLCA